MSETILRQLQLQAKRANDNYQLAESYKGRWYKEQSLRFKSNAACVFALAIIGFMSIYMWYTS